MNRRSFSKPSRRRFLTGLGGITLGLPWLEKLEGVARARENGPRRVIVMTYAMGVPLGAWRPTGSGGSMTLPYVTEPMQPFVDRSLFVSAVDNSVLEVGGDPFVWGHPAKQEAALTGTLTTGAFPSTNENDVAEVRPDAITDGAANGPSLEHVIGQYLDSGQPLRSVDLGVDGDTMPEWGGQIAVQPSYFCFEGKGNAISVNLHPHIALNTLFGGIDTGAEPTPEELALQRIRARSQSVLDAVREEFVDLRQGLGTEDQRRLDDHAERIRELEFDVALTETCTVPQGIDTVESYQGYRMDQLAPLQRDILVRAMACDLAPVGRLEFVNQQNPRFGIADLDSTLDSFEGEYDWHGMVHGDPFPGTEAFLRPGAGSVQDYDPRLLDGYRFFVDQFATLLAELDGIPEGPDTSMLDNSLVILASDLGEGLGHGHGKMGYIMSGNLGPATPGIHLDAGPNEAFDLSGSYFYSASRYNVSQLLNSILDMAGVVDEQGAPANIGLRGYLESIGAARRIDELFG